MHRHSVSQVTRYNDIQHSPKVSCFIKGEVVYKDEQLRYAYPQVDMSYMIYKYFTKYAVVVVELQESKQSYRNNQLTPELCF